MVGELIAGGVGGLGGILSGILQGAKANKLEANLVRPTYKIPKEIAENTTIAKGMANTGLSDEEYNDAVTGINRNQASGFNAIKGNSNSLLGVNNIVTASDDAVTKLNVADAQAKAQNKKLLMSQNQNSAEYKDKAFQYNEADKYAETAAKIAQLRRGSNGSIFNGLNSASQMAMSYINSQK